MPAEPEVIRQQMEETRNSLAEKLGTLEQQVSETVTAATQTVADIRGTVQDTVQSVRGTVQDTVQSVQTSLGETVDSVKNTFDLSGHVERHPWLALGGSVAVGFLVARLLGGESRSRSEANHLGNWRTTANQGASTPVNGWKDRAIQPVAPLFPDVSVNQESNRPGWVASLAQQFAPELKKLGSLAVGAMLGMVRDSLVQSAPTAMHGQVTELINGLTTRLGGEPLEGPLVRPNVLDRLFSRNQSATTEAANPPPGWVTPTGAPVR